MRKKLIYSIIGFLVLFGFLVYRFLNGPEAKAKEDFIENFNLNLKGEVTKVEQNKYGQYLLCLKILESNHKEYFPIHNPNKFDNKKDGLWEKRFFIKVKDTSAVMILVNDKIRRFTNQKIKIGTIVEVNMDDDKSYSFYDKSKNLINEAYNIKTSPIRNNIETSCLND